MKKLLISLLFCLTFFLGKSQYPTITPLGAAKTLVKIPPNGGIQGLHINATFTDTISANLNSLFKYYDGAQIMTINGGVKFWLRYNDTWVNVTGGGSSDAWLLTGNALINPTSFIGTTNSYPLNFGTKNLKRFALDSSGILAPNATVRGWGIDTLTGLIHYLDVLAVGDTIAEAIEPMHFLLDTVTGVYQIYIDSATDAQGGYLTLTKYNLFNSSYAAGLVVNDTTFRLYRLNGDSSDFVIPGRGGGGSGGTPAGNNGNLQINSAGSFGTPLLDSLTWVASQLDILGKFRVRNVVGSGGTTYATWNPSDKAAGVTLTNGNLDAEGDAGGSNWELARATIGKSTGKWYWEVVYGNGGSGMIGISAASESVNAILGGGPLGYGWNDGGGKLNNGTPGFYGAAWTTGDIIGVAFDADAGTLEFFINNVSQGVAFTGITAGTYYPTVGMGVFSTPLWQANFGATSLTYTPPTGFNAGVYTTGGGSTEVVSLSTNDSGIVLINKVDSLTFTNQEVFASPTYIASFGNSITYGTGASTDSAYPYKISQNSGLSLSNYAVAGTGIYSATSLANQYINPSHTALQTTMAGFNDLRRGGSNPLTFRKIINGLKAQWLNHFMSSYIGAGETAGSITTSGTWAGYSPQVVGGKAVNGIYTATSGAYIEYTFTGTGVGVGLIAFDSANQSGARFLVSIDGVSQSGYFSENQQTDGISDGTNNNQRGQMAIIFTGLTNASHTIRLTSDQSTNIFAIDYFALIASQSQYPPLVFFTPPKMNGTGYAIAPANATDVIMDSAASKMDSLVNALPSGYPVYLVQTNDFYNVATGLGGDNIHPNDVGQRQIYSGYVATIPIFPSYRDNLVIASGGRPYWIYGNVVKPFAFTTDLNNLDYYIKNQTSTTQSAAFKINGESYVNNILHIGTPAYTIPLRVQVGSTQYTNFLADGSGNIEENVNLARTDGFGKTVISDGMYIVRRASSVDTHLMDVETNGTKIFGYNRVSGAIGIFGAVGGGGYVSDGLWGQYTGGEAYIDAVAAGGGSFKTINIRGTDVNLQNNGTTVISTTANGLNLFNAFRPNNAAGTSGDILKSQGAGTYPVWIPQSSLTVPLSGITAATAGNSISNGNNIQTWDWNTFTNGGSSGAINFTSTSTAKTSSNRVVSIVSSGAQAASSTTNIGLGVNVNNSGTSSTNLALGLSATGATNNYALTVAANAGLVGIGNNAPTSTFHTGGSIANSITTKTATYTAAEDYTILCSTNSFTINLPAAASCSGRIYVIKNITAATTITVDGNGSETIDGATTQTLIVQYQSMMIQSDGSAWYIIGSN